MDLVSIKEIWYCYIMRHHRAIEIAVQAAITDLSVLITEKAGLGKTIFQRLFTI